MAFIAKEMFSVEGKKCIVTGGAQGLSKGMAEGLLENGAEVVLVDVQEEKLKQVVEHYRSLGYKVEEWDLVMKINLDHVFLMIQKALKVMLTQPKGGKIINVASMVSWFGGTTVPAYTASKGAVTQLTKSLAVDCAGRGININALAPGYMDTEMCANMTQARKDETTLRIPQGRWGTPEDMKGPVLFLASSASDYLNGAVIPVDGAYLVK